MHPSMHPPKCTTGLSEGRVFNTESLDQAGAPMPMRCLPRCPYRDLLGTLDHFLRAIWSDTLVPSHVRDSLQSRFHAFVQPAMESAAQELRQLAARQAGRTIARDRDGTITAVAKSATATTDPQGSGRNEFDRHLLRYMRERMASVAVGHKHYDVDGCQTREPDQSSTRLTVEGTGSAAELLGKFQHELERALQARSGATAPKSGA
jgi:hypothetical protein